MLRLHVILPVSICITNMPAIRIGNEARNASDINHVPSLANASQPLAPPKAEISIRQTDALLVRNEFSASLQEKVQAHRYGIVLFLDFIEQCSTIASLLVVLLLHYLLLAGNKASLKRATYNQRIHSKIDSECVKPDLELLPPPIQRFDSSCVNAKTGNNDLLRPIATPPPALFEPL
ncbi:uncharacterized protein TrAtP1_001528 [Trichoderma atroviride]|uniref:uncharacterized protein n=1 Tax=Hypocrea atroviridis TaxID=63577 RepID=UPI003324DD88|nr:hypothetical protein TrAtP1_001528 [Trichoderma atroviride]